MPILFSGSVQNVIHNEGSFYILKVLLDSEDGFSRSYFPTTVTGDIAMPISTGAWFDFEADWTTHPKFGKQLKIVRAPIIKNWDVPTVTKYLSSRGVPSFILSNIQVKFKEKTLDALNNVDMLLTVGLNQDDALFVKEHYTSFKFFHTVLGFLEDLDIPVGFISNIYMLYGSETQQKIMDNPWNLLQFDSISLDLCDRIAAKLGVISEEKRSCAVIKKVLDNFFSGDTYFTPSGLFNIVTRSYPLDQDEFKKGLVHASKEGVIGVDKQFGFPALYNPTLLTQEEQSARYLVERSLHKGILSKDKAKSLLDLWTKDNHIQLSPLQIEGVLNALTNPVSILTGLPGTGKSTSLKAVVDLLKQQGVSLLLTAPTGIAAKRLSYVTKHPAYTIHKAFEAEGSGEDSLEDNQTYSGIIDNTRSGSSEWSWAYGPGRPHPCQFIIIDESSMVDLNLLHSILSCTSEECKILFVGDYAQLPSVGPGNVLKDLIHSEAFSVTRLTEIFRQKDTSGIVFASHAIHKGNPPVETEDFKFLEASEDKTPDIIMDLAQNMYSRRENFQVISPRHGGHNGVTNLNSMLRARLNPKTPGLVEIKIGHDIIREDDRVMIIRNNYDKDIFNGESGKISILDTKAKMATVKIHDNPDRLVTLSFTELPKFVRLAYACTVHKVQGLEFDTIIVPVLSSFGPQLQRNLYYTAITRAKKQVYLVGSKSAFSRAITNDSEEARNSLLMKRIQKLVSLTQTN